MSARQVLDGMGPRYDPRLHHRRSTRLPARDYSAPGAYYITVCTHERACLFGCVEKGAVVLSDPGRVAADRWLDLPRQFGYLCLDEWQVMPNHLHAILWLHRPGSDPEESGPAPSAPASSGPPASARPSGTQAGSVSAVLQSYKSTVSRQINRWRGTPGAPVWERGFHDHVVRVQGDELERIRRYIRDNPAAWEQDPERPPEEGEPDA